MLKYSAIQQGWSMITIATLNCNGFKACVRKGFWTWFDQKDIDIVCLQEVRCAQTEFSGSVAPKEGWHWAQVDAEEKGYSSVAIWSKRKPQRVFTSIGLEWADKEGRAVGNLRILSCGACIFRVEHLVQRDKPKKMNF
jgi:exodeoxyribonuclease-3